MLDRYLGAKADSEDSPPVNHVISAGTHCYAAFALKQLGLKKYSLPFDWTFSSLAMVADCLNDDFAKFLDAKYYSKIAEAGDQIASNACDHLYYRDRYGITAVFNHHNPAENAQARLYLSRCVARFRHVLKSPGRKLFIAVAEEVRARSEDFVRLAEKIDAVTENAELLVIRVPSKPSDRYNSMGVIAHQRHNAHCLLHMNATSKIGPTSFDSPFDDLVVRRVIQSYSYDLRRLQA